MCYAIKKTFLYLKKPQTTTNSKPGPCTLMCSGTLTRTHAHSQQLQQTQLPTQFDASSGGTRTSTSFPHVTTGACAGSCRDPLAGLGLGLLAPPNPSGRLRLVDPAVDVGAEACRAGTPQPSRFATAPTPGSKQPLSHQRPPQDPTGQPFPTCHRFGGNAPASIKQHLERQQFLKP